MANILAILTNQARRTLESCSKRESAALAAPKCETRPTPKTVKKPKAVKNDFIFLS